MNFQKAEPLTAQVLDDLLKKADQSRIGLIGDLCLDMYWVADMKLSQLSRETPHHPLPIVKECFAPGGAGNVACNLAALRPGYLAVMGVVGNDWRGSLLLQALDSQGVETSRIVRADETVTNTYIKPLRTGISDVVYEDPRLDFENHAPLDTKAEDALLQILLETARDLDVLCVSDQMDHGCITPRIREAICSLGSSGLTVIVDSRDRAGEYTHVILKPNEVEAARLCGKEIGSLEDAAELACILSSRSQNAGVITLGSRGCMICEDGQCTHCPACVLEPPVDFCGAGDTFLSGFAVFLAAGATPSEAALAANLCSAVTVKKLHTTGTATRQELLEAFARYCTP